MFRETTSTSEQHESASLVLTTLNEDLGALAESWASSEHHESVSMEPESSVSKLPQSDAAQATLSSVGLTLMAVLEVVRLEEVKQSISKSVTVN